MTAVFPVKAGQVIAVSEGAPSNVNPTIKIGDNVGGNQPSAAGSNSDFGFEATTCIITRVTFAQRTNFQFLHTLGQQIFLYVFGDRIGQMSLSGVAFFQKCPAETGNAEGAKQFMDYYRRNKLSKRAEPVKITIGGGTNATISGFITSSALDVVSPESNLFSFNLDVATIPEEEGDAS
jgi:hypothetical protein